MHSLSFDKLKLFKGSDIQPRKPNGTPPPRENFWLRIVKSPFFAMFFFVFAVALLLAYVPSRALKVLEPGEIADTDIVAPADLTLDDQETTEKRRLEAAQAVLPVYFQDPNVFLNIENALRLFFSIGREELEKPENERSPGGLQSEIQNKTGLEIPRRDIELLLRLGFPAEIEDSLVNLLGKVLSRGIILSKTLFIQDEAERGFTILRPPRGETTIRVPDILDMKESREILVAEIDDLELPERSRTLLKTLTGVFLSANITYNRLETEARRKRAREAVETVFYTIKRGKFIIRKGDEATPDAIKQIVLINRQIAGAPSWLANFSGTLLLTALLFIALWYYLKSLGRRREAFRNFLMMGLLLILSLLVSKMSLFLAGSFSERAGIAFLADARTYRFAFPLQFGTLIFAFLTTRQVALVYTILNSLMTGTLLGAEFYPMLFCFIGGLAAIYGVKYYQRKHRTSVLRAGLFLIGPINAFVILTIHLIQRPSGVSSFLASDLFFGLLGGLFSAGLAFVLLPILESLFSIVTATRLLDLTNSDLPIFRRMAIAAPGTYHHSLIVATIAEKAAEEIRLDPMLVKAGALYHDIGKLKMPEYFIENKTLDSDAHRDLTPAMSTLVIVNHVKEGAEMGRRLKLPWKVREIIEQHHGNSLVRYFFQKAKEQYNPGDHKINEQSFRYPGRPPRSKEAALVMIADSVEAAARSLKLPKRETLKKVITDIINAYLQDGQLDDCDFSLRELRTVASSLQSILFAVYHPRVSYPGFDFEKKHDHRRQPST